MTHQNPNRTIEALQAAGGTPKHQYLPREDSMFFDTGICGLTGETNEVCDPLLLDVYIDLGIDPSLVPNTHFFDRTVPQLPRLRFRMDRKGSSYPTGVIETVTMEEALAAAKEYNEWLHNNAAIRATETAKNANM
ncbi:hypothetical protein [uncultured Tateyamaria sp.]|nr:hypothetical protein [uncultured Tateyamaria sp.]